MEENNTKKFLISAIVIFSVLAIAVFLYFFYANKPLNNNLMAVSKEVIHLQDDIESDSHSSFFVNRFYPQKIADRPPEFPVVHLSTPDPLKGLYMTSWVAGTSKLRDRIIGLADKTEINAIVVDLKDYSGHIAYPVDDSDLRAIGSVEKRIPNLKNLTSLLHSKGIYVIGRVACFQDPYFVKLHPEYAMKKDTDRSEVWTDHKGLTWLDAGEQPVWDYLIAISKDAYAQGVDEIQFDYTRFPSDGDMKNIFYPISQDKKRADVINDFWAYLNKNLHGTGPVISVDLFGLVTTANDDLGIGQFFENALTNFDYVSPMVYPSHFAAGWHNFKDPQAHPYEVIKISMDTAVARAKVINEPASKVRPWLQDFGLYGVTYGPKEVRAQIQATNDAGLSSWMLWDASNNFTPEALLP
jgi:hypothetical protein